MKNLVNKQSKNITNLNDLLMNGIKSLERGQVDQCIPLFEKVLKLDPENSDALHFYGVVHLRKGDLTKGLTLVERAIEINPAQATYYRNNHALRNLL